MAFLEVDDNTPEFKLACFIANNISTYPAICITTTKEGRDYCVCITSFTKLLHCANLRRYELREGDVVILSLSEAKLSFAKKIHQPYLDLIKICVGHSLLRGLKVQYDATLHKRALKNREVAENAAIEASNNQERNMAIDYERAVIEAENARTKAKKIDTSRGLNKQLLIALSIVAIAAVIFAGVKASLVLLGVVILVGILVAIDESVRQSNVARVRSTLLEMSDILEPSSKNGDFVGPSLPSQREDPVHVNMGQEKGRVIIHTSQGAKEMTYDRGSVEGLFSLRDVASATILTQTQAHNFGKKLGWSTVAFVGLATVFSGGLGVIGAGAALLTAGNTKKVTYLITLRSGMELMITSSDKVFHEVFLAARKRI